MLSRLHTILIVGILLIAAPGSAHAVMMEGTFGGIVTGGAPLGDPVSGNFSFEADPLTYAYAVLGQGVIWPFLNISYNFTANGTTTSGNYNAISLLNTAPPDNNFTFTLGSSDILPFGPSTPGTGLQFTSPNIAGNIYSIPLLDTLSFSGDHLNGDGNIDGIGFELDNFEISPVSLPPALSLFCAALVALSGIGFWRKAMH